jgi:hypothetical protein
MAAIQILVKPGLYVILHLLNVLAIDLTALNTLRFFFRVFLEFIGEFFSFK